MPGTLERPIRGPKKRLIITCDGTWLNADNGLVDGHKQQPSNVSRIGWAIKDTSRDGIPQVVNYQAGVGTSGLKLSRVIGGATGEGIKENIRVAYTYVATNWREGDEIFLMGYSRGAFTARSVGGIIGELGLLTRTGLPHFNEIFEDLERKDDDRYVSQFPDDPFPDKGRFDSRYLSELVRRGMTRTRIPIKAICCWDTVGSLGIPRTAFIDGMTARQRRLRDYQFSDTKIHPCVENAFQALALDEHRAPFSPALWEKQSDNQNTNLKQVWFPGVHANVGGGYDDQELSNITLAWMMSRLEPFLDFRPDFLVSQLELARQYYKDTGQRPRWWSFGQIRRSFKGPFVLAGSQIRTPGNYYRVDPGTGRTTSKRLKNTNEYIHASVRARVGLKGPGAEDRGGYSPRALEDWNFEPESSSSHHGPAGGGAGGGGNLSDGTMIVWTYRGTKEHDGQTRIPEAVLLQTELALLEQFHAVDEYIRAMRMPHSTRKRQSKRDAQLNGFAREDGTAATAAAKKSSRSRRNSSLPVPYETDGARRVSTRRRPHDPGKRQSMFAGNAIEDDEPNNDDADESRRRRRRRRDRSRDRSRSGSDDLDDDEKKSYARERDDRRRRSAKY